MSEQERISRIISPIAKKYGVDKVYIFGSRARGDQHEGSDYDFLISKGDLQTLLLYVAFINELEEMLGTHVDVVTDTSCDQNFIDNISKESVLLYER